MNAAFTHDDRSVVKRRFIEENIGNNPRVGQCVHLRACGRYVIENIFLFKDNQRPHFLLLQCAEGFHHSVDGVQLDFVRVVLFTE